MQVTIDQPAILKPNIWRSVSNNNNERFSSNDTTQYESFKLPNLARTVTHFDTHISLLHKWSNENNLCFNCDKTTSMLFATSQMYRRHNLSRSDLYQLSVKDVPLECVEAGKVLVVSFDENLNFGIHSTKQFVEILL